MKIMDVVRTIKTEKKNINMIEFYKRVLDVNGNNHTDQLPGIIDMDCTKVLNKDIPLNMILSYEDAIKIIGYKLLKVRKLFLISKKISEEYLDSIMTREAPSGKKYSIYLNALSSTKAKKKNTDERIRQLQDYREMLELLGGD